MIKKGSVVVTLNDPTRSLNHFVLRDMIGNGQAELIKGQAAVRVECPEQTEAEQRAAKSPAPINK